METGGTETHSLQVLYSLQWHQPQKGEQAQAYHSWTHTLLGVVQEEVSGPSGPPVKVQENTALIGDCGLSGTSLHVFLSGLEGKECSICVHSVNDNEVGLSLPLLAEAQFVVCGFSALFSWATICINHPDLCHLRTEANAGRLLAEEPNQPPGIIRISGWKRIHCLKAALSGKQA